MNRSLLLMLAFCAVAPQAFAGELYAQYIRWRWTEEDTAGRRLLTEDGPLLGLGGEEVWTLGRGAELAGRLEGFAGEVDYDGTTQLGEPVRTTTEYYGLKTELDARVRMHRGAAVDLIPFAGLGARTWLRRIDHTSRFSSGYDEAWYSVYGRVGGRLEWEPRATLRLFASAALLMPFYNRVRYSLSLDDSGRDVTVEPGNEMTYRVETGVNHGGVHAAVFYEQLAYARSDTKSVPPFDVFQPESRGYFAGIRFGVDL